MNQQEEIKFYGKPVYDLRQMRSPVVEQCEGCNHVVEKLCDAYLEPSKKWLTGNCPLASHIVARVESQSEKVRVGQQKQKKKTRRK